MLTELALLLCSVAASLAVAAAVARLSLQRPSGPSDVRRLAEAASRASDGFLWREDKLAALAALGAAFAVVGTQGFRVARGLGGELATAGWMALGVLLGGVCTALVAHAAAAVALRAATRAAALRGVSSAQAVALSVRAGGALGLTVDAASTASVAVLFAVPFFLDGGTVASPAAIGAILRKTAMALPGFSIGAACTALVYQHCGATYHASSSMGGSLGAEQRAGLDRDDARNPALVATLVGHQVGLAAGRAVDAFVIGSLGNVAAWLVGVMAFTAQSGPVWGIVTLPLVARAVGALASAFGLFTTRAEPGEPGTAALWRGHTVACVVAMGGVAGASLWLLGGSWRYLTAANAIGVLGIAVSAHLGRWLARGSAPPVREVTDAARGGSVVGLARALAEGLASTWLPVLGLGVSLAAAWEIGARSGIEGGALLGLATALSTSVGLGAYVLALGLLTPICRAFLGLRAVGREEPDPDTRRETLEHEATALEVDTVAQTYFAVLGPAAAIFSILAFPAALGGVVGSGRTPVDLGSPAVVFGGLLGAATVLTFAGRALGVAARAARLCAAEVERQLKGFPRDGDIVQVPREFTPTYRLLVDQAGKAAEPRVLSVIGAPLLVPVALGIGLRLLYSSPSLAIQGLAAFVVIASATGLATALTVDATRAVLGASHWSNRPRGSSPGFETSASSDALADLVGSTAAPAGLLVAKAVATAALVIIPFLS